MGLAIAAIGTNGIAVAPRIIGIRHVAGTGSNGTVTLTNPGATPFTVGSIVYNCGTAPAMQLLGGSGGQSFNIAPSGSHPVVIECPSTLGVGMHRCTFSIRDGADDPILAIDGFCETRSSANLQGAPSPVPFANAIVGVESAPVAVVISNQSVAAVPTLQLQVDNDNFLIGAPCQNQLGCDAGSIPGMGDTTVNVICKPSSAGPHTGKLHAVGTNGNAMTPIDLSCTTGPGSGGPVLALTPPNVSLGDVEVEMGTSGTTIQMTNAGGGASLTITSITISDNGVTGAGADWQFALNGACPVLPCTLASQQSLNAQLTFDPSGLGSRPAKMTINYTDPGAKQASANLDGNGLGATLELVSSNAIDFGVVPVGMAAMPQQFALRNQGNRSTTATLAASPMAPFTFPISVTVPPGETPVSVGCFSSVEMLGASATLNITSTDATTNPQTLELSCDVRTTLVTADPPTIPLGELVKGSSVDPVTVTFDRVTAGSPIALGVAALSPDGPNVALGQLSQMTTPASVTLAITPTQDGVIDETISVVAGGQTIDVPITGSVATASFTTTPVMTLGTFCVGQPTTPSSVSFTSTGTATISIADVTLTQGAASPFDLDKTVPSTYPTSLAPLGGKATVLVTPKRADAPAEDGVSDMLTWSTSAGAPSSTLTARYVADGGAIAPGELDYGDVPIRIATDNDQQVTLQNCSTGPLELLEPEIPAPFVLTDQFPTLLDPAGKATFSVAFQPTQVGPVERELVVTSTARDEFRVTLRGNGVSGSGSDDDDDDDLDSTSFYACSGCASNDPSGVLAIAFATMCGFVSRRRRRSRS